MITSSPLLSPSPSDFMAAVDEPLATSFFSHSMMHEEVLKAADEYVEDDL